MAERKRCQGLNSKCFLITYLAIVGFLLLLWSNGTFVTEQEHRQIPRSLHPYLASPPKPLTIDYEDLNTKSALTSKWFEEQWTWVYFSHEKCFPVCTALYKKLSAIQSAYASNDIKIVIFDLDGELEAKGKLQTELKQQGYDLKVVNVQQPHIQAIAKQFSALFLKTDYSDGSYQIEQEHDIFLVDPKARLYAQFNQQISAEEMRNSFIALRQFYAETE